MIEFNLLPDVKMKYLRAKRTEHLIVVVSFLVGAASLTAFILMFLFVDVAQKVILDNLSTQISTSTSTLENNKDLNKVLTVQKQLQTIPQLENQSPKTSELFSYLTQLVPANVTISTLNVSFTANNINLSGSADSIATVNTFVDTLKYVTYNDQTTNVNKALAFNTVVLSSINLSNNTGSGSSSNQAQYTITANFDPTIFLSTDQITMTVPTEITTRSVLNQPELFKANPSTSK